MTDAGFLMEKDLLRCLETLRERLPAMGLDLIHTIVVNLPEHSRNKLTGRAEWHSGP